MNRFREPLDRTRGTARESRGFTLVELMVSLILITVIMALSVQLLRGSQLAFLAIQASRQGGTTQDVLKLMRRDVHRASGLQVIPGGDLLLGYPDSSTITYSVELGSLVRRLDPVDLPATNLTIARDVTTWDPRAINSRLVEIEFQVRGSQVAQPPPSSASWSLVRRARPGPIHRVRMALRGGAGRRSW